MTPPVNYWDNFCLKVLQGAKDNKTSTSNQLSCWYTTVIKAMFIIDQVMWTNNTTFPLLFCVPSNYFLTENLMV